MRARALPLLAGGLVAALAMPLAACSSDDTSSEAGGKVKITVAGLPPTTQEKTRKSFEDSVAAFQKANPDIEVTATESKWEAKTFAARLAGGQLETVFLVPLTEPQGLIKRRQAADITAETKQLPHAADLEQRAMAPVTADGKTYGLPTSMFALGLIYNRDLFVKAGLNPDTPPKTWDEVRTAAKAIHDKTGVPGFAQPTTNNTGGWSLSVIGYTFGGRLLKEEGDKFAPALTEGPTQKTLEWLAAMRWQDKSMGTQQLRNATDLQQDFAAGKVGMMVATPSTYGDHVTKYNGDPKLFGVAALPSGGTSATLAGGTVAMVSPKASAAQRAAAVKWIDYFYLRKVYDVAVATERAQANVADKVPVGMPRVQFYSAAVSDPVLAVERKYANVPLDNFKPYEQGVATQEFRTEPPVAAQDIYAALDTVLQAVLGRSGTDVAAELRKAEEKIKPALERAQQ
jgi:multiple sugar transport system substrate-binding protein